MLQDHAFFGTVGDCILLMFAALTTTDDGAVNVFNAGLVGVVGIDDTINNGVLGPCTGVVGVVGVVTLDGLERFVSVNILGFSALTPALRPCRSCATLVHSNRPMLP